MGVSMVISFRSLRQRQVRPMTIFVKIVRRTIILFGLGLFVSNCKSVDYEIKADLNLALPAMHLKMLPNKSLHRLSVSLKAVTEQIVGVLQSNSTGIK